MAIRPSQLKAARDKVGQKWNGHDQMDLWVDTEKNTALGELMWMKPISLVTKKFKGKMCV